jgi:thiosulfate/3-mercaptopyruvate sulfurtransferase
MLRAAGVREGSRVVVHDVGDGFAAARAWWILRWAGLADVAVLDGGWEAWVAAGGPVTAEPSRPEPGDLTVRPGGMPVLDAAAAARLARDGILLDVRAGERYRGEHEPVDPVAGHIPGAVNAPTLDNAGADGRFHPAEVLRRRFAGLGVGAGAAERSATGGATTIGAGSGPVGGETGDGAGGGVRVGAYCGSGVSAAHTVLALELAGVPAALYVGSWSNWVADPARPVATGPRPG